MLCVKKFIIPAYKTLIIIIIILQAPSAYTAQQVDENNLAHDSKKQIEDIKKYVNWYPHLDEGFRIVQIKDPLFPLFHDFLVDAENIADEQISNFGEIIQGAENLIADHIKNAFFSDYLGYATASIYQTLNDNKFDALFSELLIDAEKDKHKSAFDQECFFQIQVICFVMKHRHNFMKNILKSWFDEQFKIVHDESYNLIFKDNDSDLDEFERPHIYNNIVSKCITHDKPYMLKFIIETDPNYLQFQDKNRNGLLHYAVQKNAIRCAQLLIDQQININLRNYSGVTPLFLAVTQRNTEITQILIDAHANLDMRSESRTPLRRAVDNNHIEITQMLLNAGANQRLHEPHTFSPLDCAGIYHYEDIIDILIHAGPTNPPSYHDLKTAKAVARTPERKVEIQRVINESYPQDKAEIQRVINESYPQDNDSCCTIS